MSTERDTVFMRQALREARKGLGRTSPNPCVGAVIVRDGNIVARGYHQKAGAPHAEINALRKAKNDVRGATMYVTLEPCNHTGRTPPCSHALVQAGIGRVVVGMEDPNPLVDGTGVDYLRAHGVEVTAGVLEEECRCLNLPFIKHITTGMPYLAMKAGISLDGKLNYRQGHGGRITGAESQRKTHRLRNTYDAIMVGGATVRIDDPALTTRLPGRKRRDPLRVILDPSLTVSPAAKVFAGNAGGYAWVFCSEDADGRKKRVLLEHGVQVTAVPRKGRGLDLQAVCRQLGRAGILSVLVEGGAALHGAMIADRLYDYAYLFTAPLFAGEEGVALLSGLSIVGRESAPFLAHPRYRRLGDDMLVEGRLVYP